MALLPCPFCGSTNVDPEGWASTERKGPACDDCGASAETVERWNSRPLPNLDAIGEAYEAERKRWTIRTNKGGRTRVYEVIRLGDGDPEVLASASSLEGALESMRIRRMQAAMRAAIDHD